MMEWIRKNDIFSKMFALAMATLLWFYVVSDDKIDMQKTYRNFPVELTGVDTLAANNLVVTSGGQSLVAFNISGKSDKMASLSNGGVKAEADLSHITEPGTYTLNYRVVSDVSDVTISKIVSTVTVEVDRVVSRSVPVEVAFVGELPDGYIASGFSVRPDAIAVSGPEKLLGTIAGVRVTFDISEVTLTTEKTLEYVIYNESGEEIKSNLISVDTPSVKLHYGVRQTGEIPFRLTVNSYGFINESYVDVFFEPGSMAVVGAPDAVSALNQIDLGSVSLRSVFESENFTFDMPITLPYGVSSEDEEMSTVKVTIEPRGIKKTEIELTRDLLPQTDAFEYLSGIKLVVWTREENNVTSDDFDVELSYSEEQLTTGRNDIQAVIKPLGDDVLVVGSYTVPVEVY